MSLQETSHVRDWLTTKIILYATSSLIKSQSFYGLISIKHNLFVVTQQQKKSY